jgi:hypothetical protein
MRTGLKCPERMPEPGLWFVKWQIAQNRTRRLPPNAVRFLMEKKGCKRLVYRLDYFLLYFAYTSAHSIVYPVFIGRAGKGFLSQIRLVLRLENFASPGASCWLFQNRIHKGI